MLYRKLTLENIFISQAFKVKVSDYCLHNIESELSFEDSLRIDLFNFGVCLLKIQGLARPDEVIDFYDHDKKTLKNHYKHVSQII